MPLLADLDLSWLWDLELLKFHGMDYLGMALSFVALLKLAAKQRSGFLYGALSNVAWLVFGVFAHSAATVYANAIFGGMNLYAWLRWKREPRFD